MYKTIFFFCLAFLSLQGLSQDDSVTVTNEDGETKTVKIRPNKSLSDQKPLIILKSEDESFTINNIDNLGTLEPDNIESIQVFKDAKAIEQYGEAGKDGVIVIYPKLKEGETLCKKLVEWGIKELEDCKA